MPDAIRFDCPNCQANYKLVKIEAPASHDCPLTCLSCGAPVLNREGKYVLKYFRVDGPLRVQREKMRLF